MRERDKRHRSIYADKRVRSWFCEHHPRETLVKDRELSCWWCPRCRRESFARFARFAARIENMVVVAVRMRRRSRISLAPNRHGRRIYLSESVSKRTDAARASRYKAAAERTRERHR